MTEPATRDDPINATLRDNLPEDWTHRDLVRYLHEWAVRFNLRFGLGLQTPAICIEHLGRRRLGHYRLGRNGFGLRDEIAIHVEHAANSPRWRVLGTLLHEMLHAWQFDRRGRKVEAFPRSKLHDREFRAKAAELGLDIDRKGVTAYPPGETPFRGLLAKNGVDHDEKSTGPTTTPRRPPRCKMGLWMCKCGVKIRAGRAEIKAQCLDCGGRFHKQE